MTTADDHQNDRGTGGPAYTRRQVIRGAVAGGALVTSAGMLAACSGSSPSSTSAASSLTPRRGGNLRVALTGGSTSDTLDANAAVVNPDFLRMPALYNGLVRLTVDSKRIVNDLAEEVTSTKDAKIWTIRLKDGVEFHNGKTLSSEDVIYTLMRITNPAKPLNGASSLGPVDRNSMRALDKRTVRLQMSTPYSTFLQQISAFYNLGIVPVGYDPQKPTGTGPFKYQSFTPGQQAVFVRNQNYFKPGLPYLDQLTTIDSFATDTAAFNALQGGEVDLYGGAPLNLASQANGSGLSVLVSLPGLWTPFTMRVDQAPFNDVHVRQAMRFIVDRQQMIDQSLSGYGTIGNDIFSQWDPFYDSSLRRDQDIPMAKSLLKKAGKENLAVELVTAEIAVGVVQAAQVFAQQAKAAGVTVNIREVPVGTFYGPNYEQWTFAQDFWGYSPYYNQISLSMLPTSPFNETHWNDSRYMQLFHQANATTDISLQEEIAHEMQMIDFNEGGYIIYSYNKQIDLMTAKVHGFQPSGGGNDLIYNWENAWIA